MNRALLAMLLLVGACTGPAPDTADLEEANVDVPSEDLSAQHLGGSRQLAPPELVVGGHYSDVRFVDMMAAHHTQALSMAELALRRGEHPEIRSMAQEMLEMQAREIDELRRLRADLTGSDRVKTVVHPREMANSGVPPMATLERATDFDRVFLEAMIPHHAGALRLASVARWRSADPRIIAMAHHIVDAQAEEIGHMNALLRARALRK